MIVAVSIGWTTVLFGGAFAVVAGLLLALRRRAPFAARDDLRDASDVDAAPDDRRRTRPHPIESWRALG